VNEIGALGRALIDLIAIALQIPAAVLDEGIGDLTAATRIVIEQDDPLMLGSRYSHPHPVQRTRRLVAVQDISCGRRVAHSFDRSPSRLPTGPYSSAKRNIGAGDAFVRTQD
jgi:hypothetical protein